MEFGVFKTSIVLQVQQQSDDWLYLLFECAVEVVQTATIGLKAHPSRSLESLASFARTH